MRTKTFNVPKRLRFKHFTRKGYALFSCLGREVLVGTLSVATLTHAKAEGVSVREAAASDTLQRTELKLDEVVVTGSRVPLTALESAKIVSVITRDEIQRAAAESVNDILKMATGVDVRQRGGFGVQTDISINGGTFDQIAILLNGVNISNPQTGHLSADFPVSTDDIERIEIIEGAAARVYGASAFNGAINIVTKKASNDKDGKRSAISLEGGSYGTFGGGARTSYGNDAFNGSISASYKQSDGGTDNSYFRKSQGFYQGGYADSSVDVDWQLGFSTMRYGANTFYSAAYPDQYESNMRLFASVKAETKNTLHLTPQLYWNRSYDHFQLIRGSATGENFHRTDVFGASLNGYIDWKAGKTGFGAEIRQEGILSTNLGRPLSEDQYVSVARHNGKEYNKREQRTDISYFLEHNVIFDHFTATFGVVANMNTAYKSSYRLYPGVDLSYRPTGNLKLTASWNTAFRMPTFTDLFYKSPTQEGNQGLKPEQTQTARIAAQYRARGIRGTVSGFYSWGKDMIDWVMYTSDDVYHSANFRLDNRGYEVSVDVLPAELTPSFVKKVSVAYAYIDQDRKDDVTIFRSNYAMEYLRHKITGTIDHDIVGNLTASWNFRWQDRMGSYIIYENNKSTGVAHPYNPYGLLDLRLQWNTPKYRIHVDLNNLTNHKYYDLGNVLQPGFWFMGGVSVKL